MQHVATSHILSALRLQVKAHSPDSHSLIVLAAAIQKALAFYLLHASLLPLPCKDA